MALQVFGAAKDREDTFATIVCFPDQIARRGDDSTAWPHGTWSGPRKALVWTGATVAAWVVTLGPVVLLLKAW